MQFHAVADNAFTKLAAGVTSDATTIIVNISILDQVPTPFYVDINQELLEVTAVSVDDPSVGQSTWTVVRGIQGTPAAYASGLAVLQRVYAAQTSELQASLYLMQKAFEMLTGAATGVITPPDKSSLEASPGGDMVVDVAAGVAIISGGLVGFTATQQVTVTAPESGSRTDLIQLSSGNVLSIKTGSTTPDAGNIGIAEIAMTDATVEIEAGNITDVRTFI